MDKLLGVWIYLQARLAEPSTHASISALLTLAGLNLDQGIVHDSLTTAGVVFGALGFFVKEAKPLSAQD
jgi:hypothetical protein